MYYNQVAGLQFCSQICSLKNGAFSLQIDPKSGDTRSYPHKSEAEYVFNYLNMCVVYAIGNTCRATLTSSMFKVMWEHWAAHIKPKVWHTRNHMRCAGS